MIGLAPRKLGSAALAAWSDWGKVAAQRDRAEAEAKVLAVTAAANAEAAEVAKAEGVRALAIVAAERDAAMSQATRNNQARRAVAAIQAECEVPKGMIEILRERQTR
jgi:D-alanyl-D-alanine dipeptidase